MNNLNGDFKIVGDQAYRGYEHIVIPGITRNSEIPNYTEELAKQRLIVENTFGLFKGKFKRFYYKSFNGESENFVKLFTAAVVLHNLIIDHN